MNAKDMVRERAKLETHEARSAKMVPAHKRGMSIPEFAATWSVSRMTVYRLIRQGLPVVRIGAVQRVDIERAVLWLRERTPVAEAAE